MLFKGWSNRRNIDSQQCRTMLRQNVAWVWPSFKDLEYSRKQSSEQAPFTSEIMGLILAGDSWYTHVKRVSQRSTESRGFSPGTPVSFYRECWQGGLGLAPDPSTVAVFRDLTGVIRLLPEAPLESFPLDHVELRKNLTACQRDVLALLVPSSWQVWNKLLSSCTKVAEANRLATSCSNKSDIVCT